jgi:hypothetical protein
LQGYNRYAYAMNNPLKFTDPDGEFPAIVLGALIGAVANVVIGAARGEIHDIWDVVAYAGTGAAIGALATVTGGAALSAAGLSSGTAAGGALAGVVSGGVGGGLQGATNATWQWARGRGDASKILDDGLSGLLWGAAIGGVVGGAVGGYKQWKAGKGPAAPKFDGVDIEGPPGDRNFAKSAGRKGGGGKVGTVEIDDITYVADCKGCGLSGRISGTESIANSGEYVVYQGIDNSGTVKYVGITKRDVYIRFMEHYNSGTAKSFLDFRAVDGATGLTRMQARVMEQFLINNYGLQSNGGLLLNQINSIAPKYWWQFGLE